MVLNPNDRYQNVDGLAAEVEHWLADEPVSAWREPIRRRMERRVRRHKPLVTGLASVAVVGLIALAAGTILLSQANRRVQEQRDLAAENFDNAQQAVDLFLTKVSEEHLKDRPGLELLQQKLLRSALDYYQGFVRQRAKDPTLRRQLADAFRRLGEINEELNDRAGAIAALEQSVEIFKPLRAASPNAELSIALREHCSRWPFFGSRATRPTRASKLLAPRLNCLSRSSENIPKRPNTAGVSGAVTTWSARRESCAAGARSSFHTGTRQSRCSSGRSPCIRKRSKPARS